MSNLNTTTSTTVDYLALSGGDCQQAINAAWEAGDEGIALSLWADAQISPEQRRELAAQEARMMTPGGEWDMSLY